MKKKQLSTAQFSKVVDEHNERTRGKTPEISRMALLAGPVQVGSVTIHPPTIGTFLLLEQIDHPVLRGEKMSPQDALNIIYVFSQLEPAWFALKAGQAQFEKEAFRWANKNIPTASIAELCRVIGKLIQEAFSAVIAKPNSGEEGEDPLAQSQPRPQG